MPHKQQSLILLRKIISANCTMDQTHNKAPTKTSTNQKYTLRGSTIQFALKSGAFPLKAKKHLKPLLVENLLTQQLTGMKQTSQ